MKVFELFKENLLEASISSLPNVHPMSKQEFLKIIDSSILPYEVRKALEDELQDVSPTTKLDKKKIYSTIIFADVEEYLEEIWNYIGEFQP